MNRTAHEFLWLVKNLQTRSGNVAVIVGKNDVELVRGLAIHLWEQNKTKFEMYYVMAEGTFYHGDPFDHVLVDASFVFSSATTDWYTNEVLTHITQTCVPDCWYGSE